MWGVHCSYFVNGITTIKKTLYTVIVDLRRESREGIGILLWDRKKERIDGKDIIDVSIEKDLCV